jgi:hypothetical protein
VNGMLTWLGTQAHIAMSVIGAVISNRPAPARQVLIYTVALVALAIGIPKIAKLISK